MNVLLPLCQADLQHKSYIWVVHASSGHITGEKNRTAGVAKLRKQKRNEGENEEKEYTLSRKSEKKIRFDARITPLIYTPGCLC